MSNASKAQEAKLAGNAAYKRRHFEEAIEHYQEAIKQDPNDITFYSNLAAVKFEQKDYASCVSQCEQAIEVGRSNRADFKLIAKCYNRMANAFKHLDDLNKAKWAYEKALTEHRTPEYRSALSDIESRIRKREEEAYVDLDKAEEEKSQGNDFFKAGDFSNAIKRYTEAIRRNPKDAKIYSNRAACYTKLMSFDLALKDCDKAIELDQSFIKAYLRKAMVLRGMGDSSKAQGAYEKALELDPNCAEALEGYRNCAMQKHSGNPEEVRKRAMNDPEVQAILNDPAMRMILEQMQNDPNAIQEHLKNPAIAQKFMKLREAGLIQVAYR